MTQNNVTFLEREQDRSVISPLSNASKHALIKFAGPRQVTDTQRDMVDRRTLKHRRGRHAGADCPECEALNERSAGAFVCLPPHSKAQFFNHEIPPER